MKTPERHDVWIGTYEGLRYEIKRCDPFPSSAYHREPTSRWTYYVYLPEHLVKDFNALWLPTRVSKISEESRGFVTHDYFDCALADVDWHGGITFYAKHGDVEGYRAVSAGCDYQHLWDEGKEYSLEEVMEDVKVTIDQLKPLLK